jgi:membrane-bound lytic murein transglycosylase
MGNEMNQWSAAHDMEKQRSQKLQEEAIVIKKNLQESKKKIDQSTKGRENLQQTNSALKADLEQSRQGAAIFKNNNETMTVEKNSAKNTMNDVFGKLQEWLNGGLSGDQIRQYCTEMGFYFYPGCSLPSFEHSPHAVGASANATTSAAHHVTPGRIHINQ